MHISFNEDGEVHHVGTHAAGIVIDSKSTVLSMLTQKGFIHYLLQYLQA